jgi:putative membrane protein
MNVELIRKYGLLVLAILYAVGIAGLSSPYANLFLALTPFHLLISLIALLAVHPSWTLKEIVIMLMVAVFGFMVEVLGVNTGFPFGHYSYGEVLGIKVWNTPLLIGANWLMLIYATHGISRRVFGNPVLVILLGSALMVALDVVLEPAAIHLGFWTWELANPPLENYLAWGAISAFFHLLFLKFVPKYSNNIAGPLYVLQFVFFVMIIQLSHAALV